VHAATTESPDITAVAMNHVDSMAPVPDHFRRMRRRRGFRRPMAEPVPNSASVPTIGTAHNAAITTATSSQPVTPVPMPMGPLLHTTVVAFRCHSPCAARSNESVCVL
jgi:hypothetical protein